MKITFLGTGASHGIPVIGCNCSVCLSDNKKDMRLRSSIFIETKHNNIVIDVGPDFRQQMLREKIIKVDATLITHEHKDHTAGIDDVRAYNYLQKRPMKIFAETRVLACIKREYAYVFAEKRYPGSPELDLNEIIGVPFNVGDDEIIPVRAYHNLLPIYGYRINNVAYLTDIKTIEEEQKQKLYNLDVLVLSALREKPHNSHLGLAEALELIEELKPKNTYLTHLSHRQYCYNDLKKMLPANVEPAYDGLVVNV